MQFDDSKGKGYQILSANNNTMMNNFRPIGVRDSSQPAD